MPIDEQIEEVRDLLQPGAPLFAPEANDKSGALWRTVRAVDPGTAPPPLARQRAQANALLGQFHHLRYRARRNPVDLAKAVVCLEFVAGDHRNVPDGLAAVVGRFTDPEEQARVGATLLTASLADPEEALLDAGIQLVTLSEQERPDLLSGLCLAHRRRHERSGSAGDLERAIESGERAAALAPDADTYLHLAEAYRCRYALHSDSADLRRLIDLLEPVAGEDERVPAKLATAYRLLYDRTGEGAALDQAVAHGERGANAVESSVTLLRRFRRDSSLPDLLRAAALAAGERVVDTEYAAEVAAVFLAKHEYGGERADLERAVRLGEQALATLRDDDPRRPEILRMAAVAFHRRYLSAGAEPDLERATTLARWAHGGFPPHRPGRARSAVDLAAIHLTRHARGGVLAELESAVELVERLVADGCPPEWTATLSRACHARYLVTMAPSELDRAIDLGERAVSGTAATEVALPGRRLDLATAYRTRYGTSADPADLSRAVDLGTQAVNGTPGDHADLPWRRSALAEAHLGRYRVMRDVADLDKAVDLSGRAWRETRPNGTEHPGSARPAAVFAGALLAQAENGGQVEPDLVQALVQDVTGSRTASPVDQVAARHAVGELALAAGQAKLAVPVLDSAIALLPSLPPREAGWADRQQRVGDRLGLVEAAVSAHCVLGDPAGAIEVAELGRGVLLAAEANTRVELTDLHERQPRLADRFEWVCERLNTPGFPADERKRWWADYDALLEEIRVVPGFDGFLTAPRADDLRPDAGTAVLVNADRHGGHAVLVRAGADPVTVGLPGLRDVDERVAALLDAVADRSLTSRFRRLRVVPETLAWLWDAVVEPVLNALPPAEAPHRVWWAPTGALGLLPLHAAGHPGQPGALDALVSSYIPSLRGLREARRRPPARTRRGLVVAMRHTAGHPDLPGAAVEAESLPGTPLHDADAVTGNVLAALTGSTWAHFACHAITDPVSPAEGGLVLHDRPLRLPEIGGLRLAEAELAYLSACSTADHGLRHADEVLHLASAFQLAGFRHVVATLWPLDDDIAIEAAQAFYRHLPDTPVADDAATVLHRVTRDLRAANRDRPDLWAALVHSGP
ncbi:CHAT domain-containing protein [Amycolatopsis mediterranei]|uniref:CHAT domain-containing protein n=1 Tax=Amycolatopsis mediterranei TaxID=33910 RepID=UPI0034493BA1